MAQNSLNIDVSELKKMREYIKSIPAQLDKQVALIVAGAGAEAELNAKQIAPYDDGDLRASIYSERDPKNELNYRVGATVPYAPYLEFGTGSLVEVPVELEQLAIKYKKENLFNISQEPQPYLYPAVRLARIEILELLKKKYG